MHKENKKGIPGYFGIPFSFLINTQNLIKASSRRSRPQ